MQLPNLEKRERNVLVVGAIAVVLGLTYWAIQGPLDKYESSKKQIKAAKSRMMEAEQMSEAVKAGQSQREAVSKLLAVRGSTFNLWTVLNRAVQTTQLADRAVTASLPNELSQVTAVKLTLTGVSITELVELLYEVQGKDSLVVLHRLERLRPAPDGKGLQCDLVFITPRT